MMNEAREKLILVTLLLFCTTLSVLAQDGTMPKGKGAVTEKNKNDKFTEMLEYSRPNSHHAILGSIAGTWAFQDKNRAFVKGTIVRKSLYDGRFYQVEIIGGKLPLPVADGKMKEDNYKSLQIEGYDNGKAEFVSTSINNHIGSDIEVQTGTYDSVAKTFTYYWESELIAGEKTRNKRLLKVIDNGHYVEEFYEERGSEFIKVRELVYTKLIENTNPQ